MSASVFFRTSRRTVSSWSSGEPPAGDCRITAKSSSPSKICDRPSCRSSTRSTSSKTLAREVFQDIVCVVVLHPCDVWQSRSRRGHAKLVITVVPIAAAMDTVSTPIAPLQSCGLSTSEVLACPR